MFVRLPLRAVYALLIFSLLSPFAARAAKAPLATVPAEISSTHFTVSIDGQSTPVMHAALHLYFLNFEAHKHMTISVTADSDDFWARGVEVQPWRLNIRPHRSGRTITFRLDGPAKISISRPGDFFSDSEMLYLFANPPEKQPPLSATSGVHYFGPGVHHENIDAVAGDNIYLAPGAVVFGSLNIWQVDHVHVWGRGIIVYDGPQNPANDDGWEHKRNWHCIVMDNAHDITIEGLTCVVRSRTWQIQMKDSRNIVYDNIKVIGANSGNANADGMDWLGGGDTVVRNSFFRAADDVFAMQSSWEGYGPVAFAVEGNPVTNVTVENSVLSTSISNIVRAAWPEKNFTGGNFTMRDSDVLHMGLGGCGIPFALMEVWADPHGRGHSSGYHFQNIRMEDWYSLLQFQQPVDGVSDITFTDVAGLESPSLVPSTIKGAISNVVLDNVAPSGPAVTQPADIPLLMSGGAAAPVIVETGPSVTVSVPDGLIRPAQKVRFEATPAPGSANDLQYRWLFGDGATAKGRTVSHKFSDADGTLLDGTGRFRVLLEVTNGAGRHTWSYTPVVVATALRPALPATGSQPGFAYTYREGGDSQLAPVTGTSATMALSDVPHRDTNYSVAFDGIVDAPSDGSYTFILTANEQASLELDGAPISASLPPIANVCGLAGMAARAIPISLALAHGPHHLHVTETHSTGEDNFLLLWRGPHFALQPMPPARLSHDPTMPGAQKD